MRTSTREQTQRIENSIPQIIAIGKEIREVMNFSTQVNDKMFFCEEISNPSDADLSRSNGKEISEKKFNDWRDNIPAKEDEKYPDIKAECYDKNGKYLYTIETDYKHNVKFGDTSISGNQERAERYTF